ncbi:MAG: sodium-dependent bicarbonate transport family permease [Roseiflexaceae bacterium]
MSVLDLVRLNLFSPMVLAFGLGIIATLVRSDLKFPEELYTAISIYLLLAIGLRGGAELSHASLDTFWRPALVTLALGIAVPIWSYAILRGLGRFDIANAAAIAAHYGSVSAVTFAASQTFLEALRVPYEGFMPTLVAVLEVPAIIIALLIARTRMGEGGSWNEVLRELLTGRSILLLLGGMVIGYLGGDAGLKQVAPLFVDLYKGALTLFLLEMGMVAARRFRDLRSVGLFLLGFGIVMPLLHGLLGVWLGTLAGLSEGGCMILAVLAASASYIAAPAAVRIALPQANPSYYLTASLGITFPFNLVVGIPLYYSLAQLIHP